MGWMNGCVRGGFRIKRIFVRYVIIYFMLSTFSACKYIDFDAQYIRSDILETETPAIPEVISTREQLEFFFELAIEQSRERAGFDIDIYSDITNPHCSISEAIEKYSNEFFRHNYLVIINLIESSGSIRHEVERVNNWGTIVINRIRPGTRTRPGMVTNDMAKWHIIVELDNSLNRDNFTVRTRNVWES